jgi:manganese transport protein
VYNQNSEDIVNLKKLVKTLSVIGPAVLVSVELFDPASIVTATASGALAGFGVLWAAFYSGILLIIMQEISARLGVVTGKTLAENIRQKYGTRYSFLLFGASVLLDYSTLTAEVMGLSLAISVMFKTSFAFGVLASVLIATFLVYFSPYSILEKVIMFLVTVIFLVYIYFLFILNFPLETIIYSSVVPSLNPNSFYYAEAIIGASIMPTYIVLHSGLVYEKGWFHHHEKGVEELVETKDRKVTSEKVDSVISLLMGTFLNIVIITTAAILLQGRQVNTFSDISFPFYDKLGNFGTILFTAAFACAGISAITTVGIAGVYNTFGFLGIAGRIKKRRFRLAFILWLIIAGVASFIPNQVQIMVFTQYLNGALLPFIIIPLVLLAKNEDLMGKYRIKKVTIVLALATVMITTLLFLLSLSSFI